MEQKIKITIEVAKKRAQSKQIQDKCVYTHTEGGVSVCVSAKCVKSNAAKDSQHMRHKAKAQSLYIYLYIYEVVR